MKNQIENNSKEIKSDSKLKKELKEIYHMTIDTVLAIAFGSSIVLLITCIIELILHLFKD
jgi:hypothetical protein